MTLEQEKLNGAIEKAQSELDAFHEDTVRADSFLEIARRYTDFSELTTPMIFEFVDKIIVHAPEKIDGERSQEVEIFLKFIGRFDVPMSEPTPEELAQQEKLRRRRARDREKLRRWREKVRQEKAAAEAEGSAMDTGTKE